MSIKLTMHVKASARTGQVYGSGTPFQYEVRGLPNGQEALIAKSKPHERWRIMRVNGGVRGDWTGEFETAEQALQHLQAEQERSAEP